MKKGITLTSLIVTIVVLIILTGTVMLVTGPNGIIAKTQKAVMKNDIAVYREQLTKYIAKKQIETRQEFDVEDLTETTYDGIKDVIKSFAKRYENKIIIYKGKIAMDFSNLDNNEKECATESEVVKLSSHETDEFISSDAIAIKGYKIYGNSIQSPAPSPSNPVQIYSLGEQTRNLLPTPYVSGKSRKDDGVIFKVNDDGSIRITGNNTGWGKFIFTDEITLPAGQYIASGNTSIKINGDYSGGIDTFTDGITLSSARTYSRIYIMVRTKGIVDATIYPQLEKGTIASSFIPHKAIEINNSAKNLFTAKTVYVDISNFNVGDVITCSNFAANNEGKMQFKIVSGAYGNRGTWATQILQGTLQSITHILTEADIAAGKLWCGKVYDDYREYSIEKQLEFKVQVERGSSATEYEPYYEPVKKYIDLTEYEPLRKIGSVCDYIDYEKGVIVRKIGKIVYTGQETNWRYETATKLYWRPVPTRKVDFKCPMICTHYKLTYKNSPMIEEFRSGASTNTMFQYDSGVGGVNNFKNWVAQQFDTDIPLTVYFELADESKFEEPIDLPKLPDNAKEISIVEENVMPSTIKIEYYTVENEEI